MQQLARDFMIQQFYANVSGVLFVSYGCSKYLTFVWQNKLWYYVVTRHLH